MCLFGRGNVSVNYENEPRFNAEGILRNSTNFDSWSDELYTKYQQQTFKEVQSYREPYLNSVSEILYYSSFGKISSYRNALNKLVNDLALRKKTNRLVQLDALLRKYNIEDSTGIDETINNISGSYMEFMNRITEEEAKQISDILDKIRG